MMTVKPYKIDLKKDWDKVLSEASNAHFFFNRDYLEYHSDRIKDASLIAYNHDTPVAILPCSVKGDCIISHGGLTYGGLIYSKNLKSLDLIEIFKQSLNHFSDFNFKSFFYKKIPSFYHLSSNDADEWALLKLGAKLDDIKPAFVIDNHFFIKRQTRRIRSLKKGIRNNFSVNESNNYEKYWDQVLIKLLEEKYGVSPVHSIEEIIYLKNKFPDNIKLFTVEDNDIILAGTVVFINQNCVHTQYIGASNEGKSNGAQDLLYDYLITQKYKDKKYFSFGGAEGTDAFELQSGLVDWKEGFGARGCNHYVYYIDLKTIV